MTKTSTVIRYRYICKNKTNHLAIKKRKKRRKTITSLEMDHNLVINNPIFKRMGNISWVGKIKL